MAQSAAAIPRIKAWLVWQAGPSPGIPYLIGEGKTRVGRSPENDLVIQGLEAASVSLRHLEIDREGDSFRIHDLNSTNGTYLNGERIEECELRSPAIIRLGSQGPELAFTIEQNGSADLDKTIEIRKDALSSPGAYETLLSEAVEKARRARFSGVGDQTMSIMREALHRAVQHGSRRFRLTIWVLAAGLVVVCAGAAWNISLLKTQKRSIDQRIRQIETQLQQVGESRTEADRLITQLATYQGQAEELERNPLYRVGVRQKEDFLTEEIRALLAEFGAEAYSIPPEFVERVNHYIEQYEGPDRPILVDVFSRAAPRVRVMRQVLEEEHLPLDLAYIPLVESALEPAQTSAAGAAGPWQLTPPTARAFGLRVDKVVDERMNLRKSTGAACQYLRALILDFGSGSSVMLALAAYNIGPGRVKQAVTGTVRDPIKQRNFWYLYRMQALPRETREYVPKVVAAMIIGRNQAHFGF